MAAMNIDAARTRLLLAAFPVAIVTVLASCGSSTAGDIQSQNSAAMRSAQRYATEQAGRVVLPQPLVINQGRDLGCNIRYITAVFGAHPYDCIYVYEAFALDNSRDPRPRVAQFVAALKASGWTIDDEKYLEYMRDPQRVVLFPLAMERPGTPDHVWFNLDVVPASRVDYCGHYRYEQGLMRGFQRQLDAGQTLYGFRIEYAYAVGECQFCNDNEPDPRRPC
jgi:hypothetical protein